MKHVSAFRLIVALFVLLIPLQAVADDFGSFLDKINVHARADLGGFRAELSATFGTSETKIDGLLKIASEPADAYMLLRIGELSRQPLDRVVTEYRSHRGKGWGVIAKNLGIQPGSSEFHALKQNKLSNRGGSGGKGPKGKGRG
jgi:hypothetical protein